jgi:arylsulfatase A-like enzyme
VIEHAGALAIRDGRWKYIEPSKGPRMNVQTNTELANDPAAQLYDLETDLGETKNIAAEQPDRVQMLAAKLARIKAGQ